MGHTLGADSGEFAVDDEGVGVVFAGGETSGGEEGDEGFPSDGGGDEVEAPADEVAVELQRGGFQPKGRGYGAKVQSLLVPRHYLNHLLHRWAVQLYPSCFARRHLSLSLSSFSL